MNCVKSEALKKHIASNGTYSKRCNVCGTENTQQIDCDEPSFKSKFRSLIRYHYSETDYNTHLGGIALELLLCQANPITGYVTDWSEEAYYDALMTILEPAYEG